MRERKRRHDDVHFPLQGRGWKANRKSNSVNPSRLWCSNPITREENKKMVMDFLERERPMRSEKKDDPTNG